MKIHELVKGDCIDVVGIEGPLLIKDDPIVEADGKKKVWAIACNAAFGSLCLFETEGVPSWRITRRYGPQVCGLKL